MRLLLTITLAALLAGCLGPNQIADNELKREHFSTICLEGISYWVRASNKSYMAPRYDKNTLQPVRCSE